MFFVRVYSLSESFKNNLRGSGLLKQSMTLKRSQTPASDGTLVALSYSETRLVSVGGKKKSTHLAFCFLA